MSKTTAAKSDRTRQRILEAAAAAFREHGVDRVGVRDVMELAGLTRGGFYFHFADKEALLAEATREAARGNAVSHMRWAEGVPQEKRLQALIEHYLSEEHRDNPQDGCLLAALGSDTSRCSANQRQAFTEGLDWIVEEISSLLPSATAAERRMRAGLMMSSMAGVLTMSRVLTDRARSNALLAAARQFYSTAFAHP